MAFGVGDQPVIFLLSVAAVWPLLLNTAAGVAGVDAGMLLLAKSLCANRFEMVVQVILPSILSHLVTGLRLAVGIAWIVLVPAEMLGVRAGLGYYILDAVYSATIPPQTPLRRSWQRSGPAFQ
jgi:NitT/TauT family transport system permease protein